LLLALDLDLLGLDVLELLLELVGIVFLDEVGTSQKRGQIF